MKKNWSALCRLPGDTLEMLQIRQLQSVTHALHFVNIKCCSYDCHIPFCPDNTPFPWQQLHCLELHGLTLFFSRFLTLLASLRFFRLEVCPNPAGDAEEVPPKKVTLPHLQVLALHASGAMDLTVLFRHLFLPSLEWFSMSCRGEWNEETYEIFRKQFNVHQLNSIAIGSESNSHLLFPERCATATRILVWS